jgi:hypothetical protein
MCHGHKFAGLGLSPWPYSRARVIAPGLQIIHHQHFSASVLEDLPSSHARWQVPKPSGRSNVTWPACQNRAPRQPCCGTLAVCLRAQSVARFSSEPATTLIAMHLASDRV